MGCNLAKSGQPSFLGMASLGESNTGPLFPGAAVKHGTLLYYLPQFKLNLEVTINGTHPGRLP